jgi:hypothetical protein
MVPTAISQVTSQSSRPKSVFYTGLTRLSALVVLVGFVRTYYLKAVFHTHALSPLLHLHGLIMTCWIVLLIVQTWLVKTCRTHLHRRIGLAGSFLPVAAAVTGVLVAIRAVQRGHASTGVSSLSFRIVPLGYIVCLRRW